MMTLIEEPQYGKRLMMITRAEDFLENKAYR
jgi:hypothetical protein